MEERDKIRYEFLFYCQKLEDGFLSGDNARALFIRSKLPLIDLTRIWKLSDITRDNKLDVFEFSLAMHFIEQKLMGSEIPKQNDITNVNSNVKAEVVFPKITLKEKQQIKHIFEYVDMNSQDFLEMNIVTPMLLTSGLSPSTLSRIWNIADLDRDGKLCLLEFTIAMHLVKNCVKGLNLSGPVNPFACFPDEEDAIRLSKEKLALFDKEFLLKQSQENNEEELFLNSINSADCADFEWLTVYLFDGIHDSTPDEHKPDFVDENRNIFNKKDDVSVGSEDCNSVAEEEPRGYTTETIESREINKNILDVDLENIFETVSKENMDESEEAPKFIAKPAAVCYTEMEEEDEEEDPLVLSYFQRRQYLGKDLVFEDPIGSEIIGDVEFEVDFDYIINDIEKEIVDEERRLPIARVLPIYKTPPVSDEQLYEKTMVTKGSKEIDLNFIDVKAEGYHQQENRGLNRSEKDLLINTMTQETQIASQRIATNEELKNNMSNISSTTRVKNSKNFVNVNGKTEDIVEQKRLLLQSQQEERRRFRENRLKDNERKDQHSELLSSIPVVGNDKDETSDLKEDSNKIAKEPYPNNTVRSSNENQFEDEEEKKRLREAEDKEKLLLQRIRFLEKKRQQVYEQKQQVHEQKQQVLSSNHITRRQEQKSCNHSNRVDEKNNQLNVKDTPRNNQEQNSLISTSPDLWSSRSKQRRKENDEEEKRRLAETAAAKRRTEAELERQREEVLREAEKRRLEEEAKKQAEQEQAKERKRNFLENLQKLKQRVLTEEEEKSNSQLKREPNRSVHCSLMTETSGKLSGSFGSSHFQSLPGYTKRSDGTVSSNVVVKNVRPLNQTTKTQHEADVEGQKQVKNVEDFSTVKHENANVEQEKDQKKADEMRRENFKSNRELFMKKIQNEEQNVQVKTREKSQKVRPKSFYGGMFNKPVHQIIDDSLLAQNVDSASSGDLVDEEALKQFKREQELKKEHEKVIKLRQSLERESSYTVENVEQLFCEIDTDSKEQAKAGNEWDHVERREAKTSSHPHRRSLVNTLTTEWNSFIDILEEDKRWENETVKMREDISAQRKASPARTSKTVNLAAVDVVKSDCSKENIEEKKFFAKQAGKVKKLVKSYKRLSVPCFLDQDHTWNIEKSEEVTKPFETTVQTERSSTSYRREPDDKKFDSKTVIKENAPKRKTDLAHAWSNMISNQQQPD